MKTKILVLLGLRSKCCGAKITSWHHDKQYCEKCESWLMSSDQPVAVQPRVSLPELKVAPKRHTIRTT
jgi:hypothetical protein